MDLDIILPGCTFDIQQKGPRSRQRSSKLRAIIRSVEPASDSKKVLYFDPTNTSIEVSNSMMLEKASTPSDKSLQMNDDSIGGLDEQIRALNGDLAFLSYSTLALSDYHLVGPTTFLLHGPEGTGKSLLLDRLSECAWRETFRLDLSSHPKAQAKDVTETFEKARLSQPSLIIMDDLDKFLGKAEALVSRLKSELKRLEATKVVVAAAARSVYDVDSSIRTTSAFKVELEIFPPTVKQREAILRRIIGVDRSVAKVNFTALAERSHGFVGRDLHKLCGLARNRRVQSVYRSLEEEEKKIPLGDILQAQDFVTQDDFDAVIDQVQPTVLKDSILEVPKVQWDDIAGLSHVQELLEAIMIRPIKVVSFHNNMRA